MKLLIGDWLGKEVQITLRATVPIHLTGTLLQADEFGVMLETSKGEAYVPMASILHVTLA